MRTTAHRFPALRGLAILTLRFNARAWAGGLNQPQGWAWAGGGCNFEISYLLSRQTLRGSSEHAAKSG